MDEQKDPPLDFTAGVNVQDWVNQKRFGVNNKPKTFSNQEVLALSKSMDFQFTIGNFF